MIIILFRSSTPNNYTLYILPDYTDVSTRTWILHMQLPRKKATVVNSAIKEWRDKGLLDDNTANSLIADIQISSFDWQKLAKFALFTALICLLISIGAVLSDNILLAMLAIIFSAPASLKCAGLSAIAAWFYRYGALRKIKYPEKIYSNEIIVFLGILFTGFAITQLCIALDVQAEQLNLLMFFTFIIYAILGYYFKSNLIWVFALLSLGSWFGTETGYMSGWGAYYLGMNYPLRFVLFGGLLTAAALALELAPKFKDLYRATLSMGLLYLFIALWILSIFGNYTDISAWYEIKQIELFHWSLIFGLVACAAVWHGLRYDEGLTKGFGLTFLFINLYTRYFEYFWVGLHKAVFFAILAISLWLLGSRAEKIWRLGR